MYSGTGEHIDNLEMFEEKAFISKLLGMGDIQVFRLFYFQLIQGRIFSRKIIFLSPPFFYFLNWREKMNVWVKSMKKNEIICLWWPIFHYFPQIIKKKPLTPPPLHMLHRLICCSKEVKLDFDGWRIEDNLIYSGFDG